MYKYMNSIDDIKNHIQNNGIFKIISPISENIYPPPPLKLKRTPRGVDCGKTNPPYFDAIQLKETIIENNGFEKWIFTDLSDPDKKMTWWICPNTLNLTWEATHFINPSVFYTDKIKIDYDIELCAK